MSEQGREITSTHVVQFLVKRLPKWRVEWSDSFFVTLGGSVVSRCRCSTVRGRGFERDVTNDCGVRCGSIFRYDFVHLEIMGKDMTRPYPLLLAHKQRNIGHDVSGA